MRVVHVVTVSDSLTFLRGQLSHLAAQGHQVVVVSAPGPDLEETARQEGVAFWAIPMARAITIRSDLRTVGALTRRMRSFAPDVVHGHTPKGGLLSMVAAFLARVPVRIYHIHGLPHMTATGARRWILRATEAVSTSLATQVLAVSPSVLSEAQSSRRGSRGKGLVIGSGSINGVDARRRFSPERLAGAGRAFRAKMGLAADAPVVGYVGRIARHKGAEDLARAWPLVRDRHPDAQLVVAGKFDDTDPVDRETWARLARTPGVVVAGFVGDTPPLFSALDVCVMPSHREGFGVTAIEAAAMQVPVVGTDIVGLRDAIVDGRTGTLVAAADPPALATAIAHYLSDPILMAAHGAEGRARALREFIPERIWSETLRLYQDGRRTPRGKRR